MLKEIVVGDVFGRLTVREYLRTEKGKGKIWLCECVCGTFREIPRNYLTRQNKPSRSCGCLFREIYPTAGIRHGLARSAEYRIYQGLHQRCENTNSAAWNDYGGRGITVCARWSGELGFENFIADMGRRPSPQYSIERTRNHEGYNPDNCVWATRIVQGRNRRNNHQLTHAGETLCVSEWVERTGLSFSTICKRLRLGWTAAQALTEPPQPPVVEKSCAHCTKDFRPRRRTSLFCCGRCRNLARSVV